MENPKAGVDSLKDRVNSTLHSRLRVAAIRFLNPAPLMWDFEHPPLSTDLAQRYDIQWMLPSQCADQLADGAADIGLVPIAALATTPGLRFSQVAPSPLRERFARSYWSAVRSNPSKPCAAWLPTQPAEQPSPTRESSSTSGKIPTYLSFP